MEIEYGAEVIDSDGKALGTIGHVIRNTWSGEVSKFIVRGRPPAGDLMLSPQDVLEATGLRIKLRIPSDKLDTSHRL